MSALHEFERWFSSKLKLDTYSLHEGEIVCDRHSDRHVRLQDVRAWKQVFLCIGVWVIQIQTTDGRALEWSDRYGHLISLLQRVAADREEPFVAA